MGGSLPPLTAWLVQASQDQGPNARVGMRIGVIVIAIAIARPPDYCPHLSNALFFQKSRGRARSRRYLRELRRYR
jgi:hypothetical protein